MDECRLDWKKVFKEILGKNPSLHDDAESEQNAIDQKEPISNFKTQSSNEGYSSSLKLKDGPNDEHCEYKVKCYQSNCQNTSKTSLGKKQREPISSSSGVNEIYFSALKLNDSNNEQCEHKAKCYQSCRNTAKTFSCKKNSGHFKSYCPKDQTCNLSNDRQSVEVPEWSKVFKNILQGSSSTCCAKEQMNIDFPLKKSIPSRKYYVPSHRKRNFPKKKQRYSASKHEMDAEEKEVRELFARSRLFKYDCSFKSLNDLAGTGVDIFKCEKKFASTFEEKKESKVESEDNSSSDQYIKPDFPVTALVANIKPLTRDDILNSPQVEITEWWDDDLLF